MKNSKRLKIVILALLLSISFCTSDTIIFADYESTESENTNSDDTNKDAHEVDNVETGNVNIPSEEVQGQATNEEETQDEVREEEDSQVEESDGENNNTKEISPRLSNAVAHVTTEAELLAEVNDIANTPGPTKTIIINNDIVLTDEITMNMSHGKNVIIKGDNKLVTLTTALNKKHVILSGTDATTLSFENIEFKGLIEDSRIVNGTMDIVDVQSAPNGGGVVGVYRNGTINFKNVNFIRNKSDVAESEPGAFKGYAEKVTFDNVNFISNFSAQSGAAIYMGYGSGTELVINNSSFVGNGVNGEAVAGGAIYAIGATAPITITNSVFEKNQLKNGNVLFGSGGGAIATINSPGKFSIDSSAFDGNKVLTPSSGKGEFVDGGAVYVLNSNDTMEVTNSTFTNNSSFGEGGAISIERSVGGGARAIVTPSNTGNRIANCTFVGNIARGEQTDGDGPEGGGAIQLQGGSIPTTYIFATLENNTIYGNNAAQGVAPSDEISLNAGGGVSFNRANVTATNNIITGNSAESTRVGTQNVYQGEAVTLEANNNVIDGSVSDTFGFDNPALLNFSGKLVGSTTNLRAIKTLPIKPEGLADDKATATLNADQNGNLRDTGTNLADIGAFEMKWVKYVANKSNSNWTLPALLNNNGKIYYNAANPNIIYLMYPYQTLSHATKEKPIEPNPWRFTSWNTVQDGSGKNYNEATGIELLTDKNHTLYGQWEKGSPIAPDDKKTQDDKKIPVDKNVPVDTGDEIDMNILLLSSIILLAAIMGRVLKKSFKKV